MKEKTFTLEEANTLLPILETLLKRAMAGKQLIEDVDRELQDLSHRIFLHGGILVEIVNIARRRAEKDKAIQQAKDAVAEIHATGVQVKDLDIGLLDFPCLVDGEIVLLCWKLGEDHKICHWHGLTEGFAGRKPIADLNLDKKRKPEKPN